MFGSDYDVVCLSIKPKPQTFCCIRSVKGFCHILCSCSGTLMNSVLSASAAEVNEAEVKQKQWQTASSLGKCQQKQNHRFPGYRAVTGHRISRNTSSQPRKRTSRDNITDIRQLSTHDLTLGKCIFILFNFLSPHTFCLSSSLPQASHLILISSVSSTLHLLLAPLLHHSPLICLISSSSPHFLSYPPLFLSFSILHRLLISFFLPFSHFYCSYCFLFSPLPLPSPCFLSSSLSISSSCPSSTCPVFLFL